MTRTEDQRILQEPVTVILGGKSYEIKPLVIREAAPWRRKLVALFANVSELASVTADDPSKFKGAMDEIFLGKPDQLTDLFFEYTKLDRELIETTATTKEITAAFGEVFALEAPFFGSAMRTIINLRKTVQ